MTVHPHAHLVVGTAGHIDHGKTSLVRTLTGVDLDTLPEEQHRGITIALGFTHLDLPSGRVAGFVDVPGHERLVRTMVAGASGVDVALLCVSAAEGVMPQTREHLAILDLLGVERGIVALTFADLVDADLLEVAAEEVRDVLAGTALAGAPVIPFSSVTGLGREAVVAVLDTLPARTRTDSGPFRLPVDRVFTLRGHGTVVTGTVHSGRVREGDEVEVLPAGLRTRVRSLQVHGKPVQEARAGLRTAVNLPIPREVLGRGHEVASPGAVPATRFVDVRYRPLVGAPPLEDGDSVRFLVGTAEVLARLRLLDTDRISAEDADSGRPIYLQVQADEFLSCLPGDRFVLRRASPVDTLGGGVVLDPWAHPVRHRDRARSAAELARLDAKDGGVLLLRAERAGLSVAEARQRGCLPGPDAPWALLYADRVFHQEVRAELGTAVRAALERFHREHPLAPGAHRKEIVSGPLKALDDRVLEALLAAMTASGEVEVEGGRLRLPGFALRLDPAQVAARSRMLEAAREAGLAMHTVQGLVAIGAHADAEDLAYRLVDEGVLVRVGPFLGDRAAMDACVAEVRGWLARDGTFNPTDAKERLGITRKHLIPILEWLDAQRVTRRVGEVRRSYL
ncbi:MAG: selenocysteine-specific translation elongation factor [Deltaproteobacteria bacterium]|nr:selenocysteine-specific translation elongation factor [Deltaproteobacteria bacterium]